MKKNVAHYVLTAMAEFAAEVAQSDQGFESLVHFGTIAVGAEKLAGLCDGEGLCDGRLRGRVRRYMNAHLLGGGQWYDEIADAELSGQLLRLDDDEQQRKSKFDVLYKKKYDREPPDITGS